MSSTWASEPDQNHLRVCLVTGGSRGIGAAVVRRLAAPGTLVFLNYCRSRDAAEQVRQDISRTGHGRVETVQADVTDPEAVRRMFEIAGAKTGRLDVLVHSAALPLVPKRLARCDWRCDVLPQLEVACAGFLNCIQAARPLLVSGSRIVVLLTDALFHTPPVQMGPYLAAKGALWGLVRAAAKELLPRGIFVNAVSPGMTKTELLRHYADRALEIIAQDHPLARLAEPDEVAAAVALLATGPGYMSGANLVVNGGAEF
jgi:3-oxoacyl-[acyl-carrier protein] reductase